MCLLALNAVTQLTIGKRTHVSISIEWGIPDGYFEGFHISAVPVSSRAVTRNGTVYGKNSVHLLLCLLMLSDCVYIVYALVNIKVNKWCLHVWALFNNFAHWHCYSFPCGLRGYKNRPAPFLAGCRKRLTNPGCIFLVLTRAVNYVYFLCFGCMLCFVSLL